MKHLCAFLLTFTVCAGIYADPLRVEKRIVTLSNFWQVHMDKLTEYEGLKSFCNDDSQKMLIYNLLEEIHYYHDLLYEDLMVTEYDHSKRIIERILNHIDKLEEDYNAEEFRSFFNEQCQLQSKIEKKSDHYNAGFGVHSYDGKVHTQEVEMYRYLKRLTKRIDRIKKHVYDFQIKRTVWEH